VIAQRNHVGPCAANALIRILGNPEPGARGVLAVHHREVDLPTRDRIRKHRFHCGHSRCADHVADEQNPQLTLPRLLGTDGLPHRTLSAFPFAFSKLTNSPTKMRRSASDLSPCLPLTAGIDVERPLPIEGIPAVRMGMVDARVTNVGGP
jgi:hypothetical protein